MRSEKYSSYTDSHRPIEYNWYILFPTASFQFSQGIAVSLLSGLAAVSICMSQMFFLFYSLPL